MEIGNKKKHALPCFIMFLHCVNFTVQGEWLYVAYNKTNNHVALTAPIIAHSEHFHLLADQGAKISLIYSIIPRNPWG